MVLSFSVSFGLCDKPCPWKKVRSDYAQFYLQVLGLRSGSLYFIFAVNYHQKLQFKSCSRGENIRYKLSCISFNLA